MKNYSKEIDKNINEIELFLLVLLTLTKHISQIVYLVDNDIKDKRQIQSLSNSLLSLIDLSIVPFINKNNLKIALVYNDFRSKIEKDFLIEDLEELKDFNNYIYKKLKVA